MYKITPQCPYHENVPLSSPKMYWMLHSWPTVPWVSSPWLNTQVLSRVVHLGPRWCCGLCIFKRLHRWIWSIHEQLCPTDITVLGRQWVVDSTCDGGWVSPEAKYPGPGYNPLWAKHTPAIWLIEQLSSHLAVTTVNHAAWSLKP